MELFLMVGDEVSVVDSFPLDFVVLILIPEKRKRGELQIYHDEGWRWKSGWMVSQRYFLGDLYGFHACRLHSPHSLSSLSIVSCPVLCEAEEIPIIVRSFG